MEGITGTFSTVDFADRCRMRGRQFGGAVGTLHVVLTLERTDAELSPNATGGRNRSRRHQPGGVRLDLFDSDADACIGKTTVGSRQSGVQHSRYPGDLRTNRAQSPEHLQHFVGCVPNRRGYDHFVYGIRYVAR